MIDWRAGGYFAYAEPDAAALASSEQVLLGEPELLWRVTLSRAKRGDFSLVPALVQLCADDSNPVLCGLASRLLGDAGPDSVIDRAAERLSRGIDNYEVALQFCSALGARGLLADTLTLLDAFERIADIEDAEIIPVYLSQCLDAEPGTLSDHKLFPSFSDFAHAVRSRYEELHRAFGTDRVPILGGDLFGVRSLAENMLLRLREPDLPTALRRRFEAYTGLDCTSFYRDRELQPLAAAACIETFLDGPRARHYEAGVRYFFGHRIPH